MHWLQSLLPALHGWIGGEPELKEDEPTVRSEHAGETPNGLLDASNRAQRERTYHGVNGGIPQWEAFPRLV